MIQIEQVPAYVVWPIRHEVMYPELEFDSIKLEEDDRGTHLALFEGNKLISVISLFRTGDELQFRKFATLKECQGKGYGSTLLNYVVEIAKTENGTRLWCNARRSASPFYAKFGFQETAHSFTKHGYDFVIMERSFP